MRAYQKRLQNRLSNDGAIQPCIIKKNGVNFACISNLNTLFTSHFQKNIPFLNLENSTVINENGFTDFRDGLHFKTNFLPKIQKYGNIILNLIYFDGTNISKTGGSECYNCYLTFLNDKIITNNKKKYIYNIAFISKKNLNIVGKDEFLDYIITKFKNEVESSNNLPKSYCFGVIGDNQEIYRILNLKVNFSFTKFICRCCDYDSDVSEEQKIYILII